MREAQFGKLVVHAVVARPVLEAGTEPVRRGVDVRAAQSLRDRGGFELAAAAAVEHVPAAVALRRLPHHGDSLPGQGTRCCLDIFMFSEGTVQTAASRSNWSGVARRISACRAAVSTVSRTASLANDVPESIRRSAAPTSE